MREYTREVSHLIVKLMSVRVSRFRIDPSFGQGYVFSSELRLAVREYRHRTERRQSVTVPL